MADEHDDSEDMELCSSPGEGTQDSASSLIEELKNEISQLKEQLQFLSALGQGCVDQGCEGDVSGPVAHVTFFSNQESLCNRSRIEDYMMGIAGAPYLSQMQVEAISSHYQPNAVEISGGGCQGIDCCCKRTSLKATGSVEYYRGFCLDRLGAPMMEVGGGEVRLEDGSRVLYPQTYTEPFWIDDFTAMEEKRLRRMAIRCFNCGDDHHLKDCPEPRNHARITASRQEYTASMGTPGSDKRYHVTSEDDRFKDFLPGKISDKLRAALGLGGKDYPPYIYHMRELGYPPGYTLLETDETLTLYEDSENASAKPLHTKEIVYPGFNDDEWKKRGDGPCKLGINEDNGRQVNKIFSANKTTQDIDEELGALSDYEFEEGEIVDNGEVVGFGLRKFLRSSSSEPPEKPMVESPSPLPPPLQEDAVRPKKHFSLDFPPGLVDTHDEKTLAGKWNTLKMILKEKKSKRISL